MKEALKQNIVRNAAWIAGGVALVVTLLGGPAWRLTQRRARVSTLQAEIEQQQNDLGPTGRALQHEELERAQNQLDSWLRFHAGEPSRLAEISKAARSSGLMLLSVKNGSRTQQDEGPVLTTSHELSGIGSYRQIAYFLEAIEQAQGMVSVDHVRIQPEDDAGPGLLVASLDVSWYAPGSDPQDALAGGGAP